MVVRITENGEFYQSYPGFNDYFGGQHGDHPMPFLPPTSGQQGAQLVDASGHPAGETQPSCQWAMVCACVHSNGHNVTTINDKFIIYKIYLGLTMKTTPTLIKETNDIQTWHCKSASFRAPVH